MNRQLIFIYSTNDKVNAALFYLTKAFTKSDIPGSVRIETHAGRFEEPELPAEKAGMKRRYND